MNIAGVPSTGRRLPRAEVAGRFVLSTGIRAVDFERLIGGKG